MKTIITLFSLILLTGCNNADPYLEENLASEAARLISSFSEIDSIYDYREINQMNFSSEVYRQSVSFPRLTSQDYSVIFIAYYANNCDNPDVDIKQHELVFGNTNDNRLFLTDIINVQKILCESGLYKIAINYGSKEITGFVRESEDCISNVRNTQITYNGPVFIYGLSEKNADSIIDKLIYLIDYYK